MKKKVAIMLTTLIATTYFALPFTSQAATKNEIPPECRLVLGKYWECPQ
ncbi:hypothetical protein AB1I92_24590 [Bacillus mobilis]|uniref:Uncharacterized protein n=2 Tax=Bacillus mobilis TaxID=2026190 RepID=A0ABV4RY81_9BACI|nr:MULTISPECIES: hypothetical protein [Bacillus cereus group]MCC2460288.1 hypothetical protein [Bacillus mobilis]MCU5434027.1 hypothetical protein [Bacillus mobilis]MCU5592141.1 hypothetical protein [Bacillus mobilis]MCU5737005.1 hypothetical protein [Bacillus mobilis]MCU9560768.1 hypothetical protein [Bacillus mobilis]